MIPARRLIVKAVEDYVEQRSFGLSERSALRHAATKLARRSGVQFSAAQTIIKENMNVYGGGFPIL